MLPTNSLLYATRCLFVIGSLLLPSVCTASPPLDERTGAGLPYEREPSPSGDRLIYYESYNFVLNEGELNAPPLVFVILDSSSAKELGKISAGNLGRWPPKLAWLDDRYVLASGMFDCVLDTSTFRASKAIAGAGFQYSPYGPRLAYIRMHFPVHFDPIRYHSDWIGIWRLTGSSQSWEAQIVYPKDLPTGSPIPDEPPFPERHLVRSYLAWSPEGERLAFVEQLKGELHLVLLSLGADGRVRKTRKLALPEGIRLPRLREEDEDPGPVVDVEWMIEPQGVEALMIHVDGRSEKVVLTLNAEGKLTDTRKLPLPEGLALPLLKDDPEAPLYAAEIEWGKDDEERDMLAVKVGEKRGIVDVEEKARP
jgi:hypothetical protein